MANQKRKKDLISRGGFLNQLPPDVFNHLEDNFVGSDRDRLALTCSVGDKYRGVGGDAVASLRAAAVVEKQQEVDDCRLARNRVRYRAAIEEYRRCRGLGPPGRGVRSGGREYGIPPVWLRRFF